MLRSRVAKGSSLFTSWPQIHHGVFLLPCPVRAAKTYWVRRPGSKIMSMGPSGRAHGAKLYKCALTAVIITDSVFVPLGHELPFRHFRRSHKGIEGIEQLSHYFLSRNDKNTAPAGALAVPIYLLSSVDRPTMRSFSLLKPTQPDTKLGYVRKFKPKWREQHVAGLCFAVQL